MPINAAFHQEIILFFKESHYFSSNDPSLHWQTVLWTDILSKELLSRPFAFKWEWKWHGCERNHNWGATACGSDISYTTLFLSKLTIDQTRSSNYHSLIKITPSLEKSLGLWIV